MAPKSASMKGFYRQKKSTKSTASKNVSTKKSPNLPMPYDSDITQPAALISHGSLDMKDSYKEDEQILGRFDMNMAYGPCLGMSRQARWERALKLGLNPPEEIESILKRGKVGSVCLWEGRV
ncbi:hypothetical protein SAY86_007164 [Trapa natans]|uniref:DNA polymerase delta subunit 4 n=1 Tax=Trapa natans TaxID=22666 RepID=A0AAN7LD17_TRANT|nr:hypothetical protein SAY86_007164 [Trapa natans]